MLGGSHFVGVFRIRALLFGMCILAPDFWTLHVRRRLLETETGRERERDTEREREREIKSPLQQGTQLSTLRESPLEAKARAKWSRERQSGLADPLA